MQSWVIGLKKPDRRTNGQQKNNEWMDKDNDGAFSIDSIAKIGANTDKIFVKKLTWTTNLIKNKKMRGARHF